MSGLPKIFLGERENFYSIYLEYDDDNLETLFPKDLEKLENYLCGFCDGFNEGCSISGEIDILNGPPKDYIEPMKTEDFERIFRYVRAWENFQLSLGLAD